MNTIEAAIDFNFTKENLTWFAGIMDRMKLLNKTLDLSYKPVLSEEEHNLYSFIGASLLNMQANQVKLAPELSEIVKRHYPEL
jgi:hypothetical protein